MRDAVEQSVVLADFYPQSAETEQRLSSFFVERFGSRPWFELRKSRAIFHLESPYEDEGGIYTGRAPSVMVDFIRAISHARHPELRWEDVMPARVVVEVETPSACGEESHSQMVESVLGLLRGEVSLRRKMIRKSEAIGRWLSKSTEGREPPASNDDENLQLRIGDPQGRTDGT
jgi:hypothetical protein